MRAHVERPAFAAFGIGEHGRRAEGVAAERLVRLGRAVDRKLELDERIERDEAVGEQPQELLHVPALGPAHVRQRIVEPALLVGRVVAPRPVGGGDEDVGLALVERLAVELEADVADRNDAAFAPQHPHGLVGEVAALRRGRDHDCVGAGAVGPGQDCLARLVGAQRELGAELARELAALLERLDAGHAAAGRPKQPAR